MLTGCSSSGGPPVTGGPPPSGVLTDLSGPTLASGGTHPDGLVVADFNGDGRPDIAVSNLDTNTIAVYLNNGAGGFRSPKVTTVQIDNGLGAMAVGDFNEDGKADLVVATIAGSQASIVLLGNGDGTFRQQTPIPNSFGFIQAMAVDLNHDGHLDLVFGENGNVSVSLGDGNGTFNNCVELASGSIPGTYQGIAVADFKGNGKLDIVAVDAAGGSPGNGSLDFYPGNGDGTFQNPVFVHLPSLFPVSVSSGDFNADGKLDLLIGYPNLAWIANGNGDGTFQTVLQPGDTVYDSMTLNQSGGVSVLAADLNSDGKPDAVTSDYTTGTVQITLNGSLFLTPPANGIFTFALAPGLALLAVGDFNGDGALDVALINSQTNQVNILLSSFQ